MLDRINNIATCLVLEMKRDGRLPPLGKHEAHPPHEWWYTSWGGGHQMPDNFTPEKIEPNGYDGYDKTEGWVRRWTCPGKDVE